MSRHGRSSIAAGRWASTPGATARLVSYLLKQADAEALRAEKRREAADFEARVQEEVERQLLEMSAFAGHPASPPADELSSPSNDLEPAERTSPSRPNVRDNVPMSGARRIPPMSTFPGHRDTPAPDESASPVNELSPRNGTSSSRAGVRDDGRDHVPMSGAFPPRRPDEEEELTESERDEIERYAMGAEERLRRAIAGIK